MLSNLAKVESLIFVSGNDGIDKTELSQLTGILKPALNEYLEQLASKYHDDNTCSFELVQAGEVYRLVTKKSVASLVRKYFESPSVTQLSKAALETLAIIAYKQPVTRIAIENIRGVKASGMIQKLLQYGLIAESGRMDIPGRPIQYKTTDEFLNYFGLSQLSDLPKLKEESSVTEDEDSQQDLYKLFQETINDD